MFKQVCAILKGVSNLGVDSYFVSVLASLLLMVVLCYFVHVLDNVIDTIYVCYAIDKDRAMIKGIGFSFYNNNSSHYPYQLQTWHPGLRLRHPTNPPIFDIILPLQFSLDQTISLILTISIFDTRSASKFLTI